MRNTAGGLVSSGVRGEEQVPTRDEVVAKLDEERAKLIERYRALPEDALVELQHWAWVDEALKDKAAD